MLDVRTRKNNGFGLATRQGSFLRNFIASDLSQIPDYHGS
jgi:hypothetical protein